MCLDARKANSCMVPNRHPLPRIDALLDSLQGHAYFSTIDLISGYMQVRLNPEDEEITAFTTPFGHYQWRVLSFGWANAPSIFSEVMARVFRPMLDAGRAVLYMDDIVLLGKTRAEALANIQEALTIMRANGLYCNIKKCVWMQEQVKFLGHLVSAEGIRMDPDKVATVRDWPVPRDVHQVRQFLGFANYFRKFIQGMASMCAPLHDITNKQVHFAEAWNESHTAAFEALKAALTSAPLLRYPDLQQPFTIISDASLLGTGAVLLQEEQPVAYTSKKFTPAERNWTTTEQECFGVVRALEEWRCYVESDQTTTIVTDHNCLVWLPTQANLSRRMARWLEFFSRFKLVWKYQPGRANVADPLSRNPALEVGLAVAWAAMLTRSRSKASASAHTPAPPHSPAPATVPAPLLADPAQPLDPASNSFPAHPIPRNPAPPAPRNPAPSATRNPAPATRYPAPTHLPPPPPVPRGLGAELPRPKRQRQAPAPEPAAPVGVHTSDGLHPSLAYRIKAGYSSDAWLQTPSVTARFPVAGSGFIMMGHRIYVPDQGPLRTDIISELHCTPYAGHLGVTKTLDAVRRHFWWPSLRQDVTSFISTCHSCQTNKPSNTAPAGLMQPVEIPDQPWECISMDFITSLPETKHGYTAILVFVDKLTKMAHFCPTTDTCSAEGWAALFLQNVVRLHGLPRKIISDRDARFTGTFTTELCRLLGTRQALSTSFHPQTDGQTEKMNRTLEEMLRHYVAPAHDDWDSHLPCAEFAVNAAVQESTRQSPFFLNYGYHPLTPISAHLPNSGRPRNPDKKRANPAAEQWLHNLQLSLSRAKACLQAARDRQKALADKRRTDVTYAVGDQVLLHTKNLKCKEGVRKLMPRWVGPFPITQLVGPVAARLQLPAQWRIHSVFHVSLLKPYQADGTRTPPPPALYEDHAPVWKVQALLAERTVKRGKRSHVQYLVRWEGFLPAEDTWEPHKNILDPALIHQLRSRVQANGVNWYHADTSITCPNTCPLCASQVRTLSLKRGPGARALPA
jgi:hypothetical protein